MRTNCPTALAAAVKKNIDDWRAGEKSAACGSTTPRSGPATDEANWLGWLDITDEQIAHSDKLQALPSRT